MPGSSMPVMRLEVQPRPHAERAAPSHTNRSAFFRCIVGLGKAIVSALPVGCPARPTATGGPVSPAVGPVLPPRHHGAALARHLGGIKKIRPAVL
jgi:hypothetical protein